jgi:hypothetical protein
MIVLPRYSERPIVTRVGRAGSIPLAPRGQGLLWAMRPTGNDDDGNVIWDSGAITTFTAPWTAARAQPASPPETGVELLRLCLREKSPFGYRGVPSPTIIPWPTSTTIAWMKSGASIRAQAWPLATSASITEPPELAMTARSPGGSLRETGGIAT